jgi:hypothetical protein
VEWGIIKRHFSKYIKEKFEVEFGLNGKNITQLQEAEIKQKLKNSKKILMNILTRITLKVVI